MTVYNDKVNIYEQTYCKKASLKLKVHDLKDNEANQETTHHRGIMKRVHFSNAILGSVEVQLLHYNKIFMILMVERIPLVGVKLQREILRCSMFTSTLRRIFVAIVNTCILANTRSWDMLSYSLLPTSARSIQALPCVYHTSKFLFTSHSLSGGRIKSFLSI